MPLDEEFESVEELNRKIRKINFVHSPGSILLGLALFGIFSEPTGALQFFSDPNVKYGFLVLGLIIEVHLFFTIFPLLKEKARLGKEDAT